MSYTRRAFLQTGLAGLAAARPSFSTAAQAPQWPRRPVRFVLPFPAGGGVDTATRMMADSLRSVWGGVTAFVDNKGGANTIIGAESVLNAPRDGSAFLVSIALTMQLPYLLQKVPFVPLTDFVPVGAVTVQQLVLVADPNVNIKTLADLPKAAAAGKRLAFGSYGIGSNSHLMQVEISKTSGVDILHVPYRGSAPAIVATLAGEVSLTLANLGSVRQHIEAGKLIPIAVTGAQRSRFIAQVPTLEESGIKGFDAPLWIGVFAAKGVPEPVIQKLGADMQAALRSPELIAKLNADGQEPGQMSVEEFQALIRRDTLNAGRMITEAGIRLE